MGATSAPWGERRAHPRTRASYAEAVRQQLSANLEPVLPQEAQPAKPPGVPFDDLLLVGLRRREGVALGRLAQERGVKQVSLDALALRLAPFRQRGLLLIEGERWRLQAPTGLALSNAVLREILAWWDELNAP
jgi:oxygen-independent coproporphyrinogen-3 oxidase